MLSYITYPIFRLYLGIKADVICHCLNLNLLFSCSTLFRDSSLSGNSLFYAWFYVTDKFSQFLTPRMNPVLITHVFSRTEVNFFRLFRYYLLRVHWSYFENCLIYPISLLGLSGILSTEWRRDISSNARQTSYLINSHFRHFITGSPVMKV